MKNPIGFVLLTHTNAPQAQFLCEQLSILFGNPPIAIHHDFSKTQLNINQFPSNTHFVEDWIKTTWGGWSVVDAELRTLRLLYQNHDPDWFVVLSGADFPIKCANVILDELYNGDFDAYLDHRKIRHGRVPIPPEGFGAAKFSHPAWETLAFERYMALGFGYYKIATTLGWKKKAVYLRHPSLIKKFTPFNETLDCYAGDFWLTGNRATAETLLDDNPVTQILTSHFRRRPNPDEAFHQTVLCNSNSLRVCSDNKRFTDWADCTNHPRSLAVEDFQMLLTSTNHFARKFAFEPGSLRKLSEMIRPTKQPLYRIQEKSRRDAIEAPYR